MDYGTFKMLGHKLGRNCEFCTVIHHVSELHVFEQEIQC